jgi:hypothetical protein
LAEVLFTEPDGNTWINSGNETQDFVAPVNNFLHSLFSTCTLTLGPNIMMNDNNENYMYKAFWTNFASNSRDAKMSQLAAQGWETDSAAHMDSPSNTG